GVDMNWRKRLNSYRVTRSPSGNGKMVRVSAILLGAGQSKRMGTDKLSLPWSKKTVFVHCLETLLRSKVKEVIVVLNARTRRIVDSIEKENLKVVINPYYKRGMSTSIRKGLQALDPGSEGILIALGDQPSLKTRTIDALISAFGRKRNGIIVPVCEGKRGNPILFHRRHESALLRLRGDVGGRSILERHPGEIRAVNVKSRGVLKDIDSWKDYEDQKVSK
ncbi:MAG: molybdenum cofactor cytidylyltransferase, partial [Deltaproteobacteria bacterium RBG_13_53_10]